MMEVTLHVDLLWTDLEDFVEHFERDLHSALATTLLGERGGWLLWNDELYPENSDFEGWEFVSSGNYTKIQAFNSGETGKYYAIFGGTKEGPETPWVLLSAVRYRRDRLKITATDVQGWGFTERLHQWLDARWEDAVLLKDPKRVPAPSVSFLRTDPPMPNVNGHTWNDLFDWWYRGGRLYECRTLATLARAISSAPGTVKNNHSKYKAEYGEQAMPDNKSRFAGMFSLVTISHD